MKELPNTSSHTEIDGTGTTTAGFLELVVNTIPALVVSALPDGSVDFINQGWRDYTGLSLEKLQGWGWNSVIHPDDLVTFTKEWDLARSIGRPFQNQARVRRADGEYRWFLIRKAPLRDTLGNIIKWYGTGFDIEDLKQAEAKIRQNEAELQQVIDAIPAHVFAFQPDGLGLFANRQAFEYTGLNLRNIYLDDWITRVCHPLDAERMRNVKASLLAQEKPFAIEARIRAKDEEYRWFLIRVNPLKNECGGVVRWYGTRTDIDDLKKIEDELRRSEFYLAEAQRLGHIGGWVFDPTAGFDYWSRELFRIHGLDPAAGAPSSEKYLALVHPQDREFVASLIKQMLQETSGFDVTKRIVRPQGEVRYIRYVGTPVLDNGTMKRMGVGIDVTEHELLTQELRRREAYLAEAQRLSHTGSFGWKPDNGEIVWSDETFRIFQLDPDTKPTLNQILQHTDSDDVARVHEQLEQASQQRKDFDLEHRLLMPDGTPKYVHVVAHAVEDCLGHLEFVGAITDITERREASMALEKAFHEIKALKDQLYNENLVLKEEIDRSSMFEEIVGASQPLQAVLSRLSKVAPTDSTVLITGETGTGKELIARAVHKRSARSERAFVSVNCAAIPPALLASELFGHEKGAFTGALQRRLGRFELADRGTIFLDEVGELPVETQIALLRVLQEREFERVGGHQTISTDVRVIAATNRDLEAAIASGTFRSDLYYRLNVFPIAVPPLRERNEDIPMLVEYFVDRYASKTGKKIRHINKKTMDRLTSYPWPGNIRELQNVIERSVILCESETFSVDESWLSTEAASTPNIKRPFIQKMVSQEREMIEAALAESKGRVSGTSGAAAKLGIPPSTLESKIRSLKIDKRRFV